MNNYHYDFLVAEQLRNTLVQVADKIYSENEKMRHNFESLNQTWKDDVYYEYRDKFKDADETVKKIIQSIHQLNKAMIEYERLMKESL